MRRSLGLFAFTIAAAALAWAACGGASSGAGTGGADCSGGPFLFACDQCVESACCAEGAACYADGLCAACATGTANASMCAAGASHTWDTLLACIGQRCAAPCLPASSCNPVTNEGCADAGEACDLDQHGVFICFPASSPVGSCASCDDTVGPFCEGTMHCLEQNGTGRCARYCCDDDDCGGGLCDRSNLPGGVGVCVMAPDAGVDPVCTVDGGGPPAVAPSRGACFTIPSVDGGG